MVTGRLATTLTLLAALLPGVAQAQGVAEVFADFEGDDYGGWKATGAAFGKGPAAGTLPGQMPVSGFRGKRLVNSFSGGDEPTGRLTSPEFTIRRQSITFLIGGGGFAGKTCMDLVVDGKVVRTATGLNTEPGGSEELGPAAWDVGDLKGKVARLVIVDEASGGWGHVNVDEIAFTDAKPPAVVADATRELVAEQRYLQIPIKRGARKRQVTVSIAGKVERRFEAELADERPEWWAVLDISAWKGKTLTVRVDQLREDSEALKAISQGDGPKGGEALYKEALRPQFHFSARRGWLNDPNGLVYFDGEYHLFFQHNPYGAEWGNMHWGHAVGRDLVHWTEIGEVLYPDDLGAMFSGSAVVDRENTSGFGQVGKPPIVLIYTASGHDVQCVASSTDRGRSWEKYRKNPVVPKITGGNRDPKVSWHEPTKRWVMALYVEQPNPDRTEPSSPHTIQFLSSPDLKEWTREGRISGFFECPDLFELPVDGDPSNKQWVLTAASSEYRVGGFDGKSFTPSSAKLPGHRGKGFYAAQTFADIPKSDGRRIQIGWLQAPSPGMPFNQAMSVPMELALKSTADGPRLAWTPVKELESLRAKSHKFPARALAPGDDPLAKLSAELVDVRAEFEPGDAEEVTFQVRGIAVAYDVKTQEVVVNGHRAPAPLRDGKQRLTILLDRTCIEVFAADGLSYVPLPVIPAAEDRSLSLTARGGKARVTKLEVHELGSAWSKGK